MLTAGIIVRKLQSRDDALQALKDIAEQGEGPTSFAALRADSHYLQFKAIYDDPAFPETDGRLGPILWRATKLISRDPNTRQGRPQDLDSEQGQITDRLTRLWAQLLNLRYRLRWPTRYALFAPLGR